MNRSHAIKFASQLPVGHPKRREILSHFRQPKVAGSKFELLLKKLNQAEPPSDEEGKEEYVGYFFDLMDALETSAQAEELIELAKGARSDFLRGAYQDFMRELTDTYRNIKQAEEEQEAAEEAGPDPEEVAKALKDWLWQTWGLDVSFSNALKFVKPLIK